MDQRNDNDESINTFDSQSKICAEILRNETGRYTFVCYYCGYICDSFDAIDMHINDSHFSSDESPLQDGVDDDEIKTDDNWTLLNNCETTFAEDIKEEQEDDKPEIIATTNSENAKKNTIRSIHIDKIERNQPTQHQSAAAVAECTQSIQNQFEFQNCGPTFNEQNDAERFHQTSSQKCSSKNVSPKPKPNLSHPRNNQSYSCKVCSKYFRRQSNYQKHMQIHSSEFNQLFTCHICSKTLWTKKALEDHVRIHSGEKPFSCKFCEKCYRFSSNLALHMKKHSVEKQLFECDICSKMITSKKGMKDHVQIHTGRKPYSCKHCEKSYRFTSNLRLHMQHHTGNNQTFKCESCLKILWSKEALRDHTLIHTGEKPYKCKFCEKCYRFPSNLGLHMQKNHTGKKLSYKCETCSKILLSNKSLRDHVRIHTGEKPYECKFCEKSYRFPSNLGLHMQKNHSDNNQSFKCETCSKILLSKKSLLDHVRIHTGEKPYECKFCEKSYRFSSNLKHHVRHIHGN